MMTLAELKRTLKPGMILDLEHLQSNWKPGPRKILSINTVGFTLETVKADGTITKSYSDWPKASYFESTETGFIFFSDWHIGNELKTRVPLLKYTIIKD